MWESEPEHKADPPSEFQISSLEISSLEANNWWRKTEPVGALLNNLMFAFIVVPVALVFRNYYTLSLLVFALMAPYGLFVRRLAVSAVRVHLTRHPEAVPEFRQAGIIQ